jgi:N utilization substance protein B
MNNKINIKTLSRIAAIQVFHQHMIQNISILDLKIQVKDLYKTGDLNSDDMDHELIKLKLHDDLFETLVTQTDKNLIFINDMIIKYLTDEWKIQDLEPLMLVILQLAICEMLYCESTPRKVVINEFTTIASEMLSNKKEIGFINSILDNINLNIIEKV